MGDCPSPGSQHVAVWLIDIASRSVHAAGSFYGYYARDIAFAPNGHFVYLRDTFDYLSQDCSLSLYPAGSAKSSKDVDLSSYYGSLQGLAISPDSKTAYVRCSPDGSGASDIFKIDTATTTMEKAIPLEPHSFFNSAVNVTPDGKRVYVRGTKVVVLDTASDAIVTTVDSGDPTGGGLAITPGGTRVYTANPSKNTVSVIETASNTVVATIAVPSPGDIVIMPPPQGTPFLALRAGLDVNLGKDPGKAKLQFNSSFVLSSTASNGIHPETEPVKLQAGPFIATIPAGSFKAHGDRFGRFYSYEGDIDGVSLKVKIAQTGALRYSVQVEAQGARLSGIANPVQVSLGIGDDAGLTSLTAHFGGSRTAGLTK